jgi:hypothetical protein
VCQLGTIHRRLPERSGPNWDCERRTQSSSATGCARNSGEAMPALLAAEARSAAGSASRAASAVMRVPSSSGSRSTESAPASISASESASARAASMSIVMESHAMSYFFFLLVSPSFCSR